MRIQHIGAVGSLLGLAQAFRSTSPFFAFSNNRYPHLAETRQLSVISAQSAEAIAKSFAAPDIGCKSDIYILVNQPGVTAEDFRHHNRVPHLQRMLDGSDDTVESSLVIDEVVGGFTEVEELASFIGAQCNANISYPQRGLNRELRLPKDFPHVLVVQHGDLDWQRSSSGRNTEEIFAQQDLLLNTIIQKIAPRSYAVIFTTSPPATDVSSRPSHMQKPPSERESPFRDTLAHQHPMNEALFDFDSEDSAPSSPHFGWKRDLDSHTTRRQASDNVTLPDVPLFEKYTFFSAGIFMGLLALAILVSILFVGLRAISGLEVSYMAFSKEMGPGGKSKQQ